MSGFVLLSSGTILRPGILKSLFSANYLPHRFCYLVQPGLVWTNVLTDGLIALSYAAIFVCLLWIASRLRSHTNFQGYLWILVSFASFIVACGATHVMEVVTVWVPLYPLSAAFKVVCAVVSVSTAVAFAWQTPRFAGELCEVIGLWQRVVSERDRARLELAREQEILQEREHANREYAALNTRLNAVMDSTSDGALKVRFDWKITYANRVSAALLPDMKLGKDLWECFPALQCTATEKNLRSVMEDRAPVEYENYYPPYDLWFKVRAAPVEGGMSLFFSNITSEKKLQESLQKERWLRDKRIQALSNMAGGLAHEISNPLAIIYGRAADLLEAVTADEALSIEKVKAASESILRTADRAIRILRGLRGFGRDASKDPMDLTSIYTILDDCMELQQTRLERHAVALRLKVAENLPYIECREVQIGQIVTNLLNNAFDAITTSGSSEYWMELSARHIEGYIEIDVTDSGPGIAAEIREHLMEPFYSTKEANLGMGVGLSLSLAIAEDHGGSLTLLHGTDYTTFRLAIPVTALHCVPEGELHYAADGK